MNRNIQWIYDKILVVSIIDARFEWIATHTLQHPFLYLYEMRNEVLSVHISLQNQSPVHFQHVRVMSESERTGYN